DRHQHPLAVRREDNVAGRMAVAGRKFRNDGLRWTGGVQIASTIGKAHDAVGVSDIDPLRVVAARKKRNPERRAKTVGEYFVGRGLYRAVGGTENADTAGARFGHEDIAVGRNADDARAAQALREQFDLEAR